MYDFGVIGAGIAGATFACLAKRAGASVAVVERSEIGGACATEEAEGIIVHKHGAHIFHTDDEEVWSFVNEICDFQPFINSPKAMNKWRIFSMPINMNTMNEMWGVVSPAVAHMKIERHRVPNKNPQTIEEYALATVGRDIYELLIRDYTEKQWGKKCSEHPASILKRIPVRFTYDNNYFGDKYQGIPVGGYSCLIGEMLKGIPIVAEDFRLEDAKRFRRVVYTGSVDELFGCDDGVLGYRTLKFEHEAHDSENVQGVAVMNYTSAEVPYTRKIEHRHFDRGCKSHVSIVTTETPVEYELGMPRYYPLADEENKALYGRYKARAEMEGIKLLGRLGEYRYMNMDEAVKSAMRLWREFA